jgi:hypothetical protein
MNRPGLVTTTKRAIANVRLRERRVAAVVLVHGDAYRTELSEQPPVGAKLDIGFPVIVTESKQVAGGGILVAAEPIDPEAADA